MAFEQGMGFHGYRYREGPQPATPFSRSPVADYFQTTSHIYSCWDLDGNPSGLLDLPCAAAICTGVGSEKTLTSASRACRAQRKKSLGVGGLPAPPACRASFLLRPGLNARTFAGSARFEAFNLYLHLLAQRRIHKRNG